jgi:hypothetical protein
VHDFADVSHDGDRTSGLRALLIVAPEGSRIYVRCAFQLLSFALKYLPLVELGLCNRFWVRPCYLFVHSRDQRRCGGRPSG